MIWGNRSSILLTVISIGFAAIAVAMLLDDPRQLSLMRNTLLLAAGSCAVALPLGTVLALLLFRTDVFGRRLGLYLLVAMLFVPLYLQAAAWDAGFGQLGWQSLALGTMAAPLLQGWRAAVWVHALAGVPWVTLIVGVAACHVDPELEEESLLSATPFQVLLHVVFPRILGGVAVAAFWVVLTVVTEMTITDLYRVRTYAEELYSGFALSDSLAVASLSALPGVFAGASLVTLALAVVLAAAPALRTPTRTARTMRLGKGRIPFGVFLAVLLVAIAGVPLGNLIYKAGMTLRAEGSQRILGWSLGQFARIVGSSVGRFHEEIGWTILIGTVASASAMAVGTPLAWLARRGGWRAAPAFTVVAFAAAVPGPLIGLGVIWLLDRQTPGICVWLYDRTIFAPVLAILIRLLPLAVLLCWYVLRSVSDDVLDSAASEGAGSCARFCLIVVPQRWSGLIAVWLALLAVAAGDLACSVLVVPPGVTTISVRVFGLIHAGVDDQVAGLCLTVLAGVAAIAIAAGCLLQLHVRAVSVSFNRDP